MPLDAAALGALAHLKASSLGLADGVELTDWPSTLGGWVFSISGPPAEETSFATYRAAGLNGHPAVESLTWPLRALLDPAYVGDLTVVVVSQTIPAPQWTSLWDSGDADFYAMIDPANWTVEIGASADGGDPSSYVGYDAAPAGPVLAGHHVSAGRRHATGIDTWEDGAQWHEAALAIGDPPLTYLAFGAGVFAEALVLPRWASDNELGTIMRTLSDDYGTPWRGGQGNKPRKLGPGGKGDPTNPGSRIYPPVVQRYHDGTSWQYV